MKQDALQMSLLFDYYGELLSEKQRVCFDLYYNQDLSLAEIARECGFRESAYLARVFKQHVGTTPLSYRTAMRKKRMG